MMQKTGDLGCKFLVIGLLLGFTCLSGCGKIGGSEGPPVTNGTIVFAPESMIASVNESFTTVLTLNNSQNVDNVNVAMSSDSESITFTPSQCSLSSKSPSCVVSINAKSLGIAHVSAEAIGYTIEPFVATVVPQYAYVLNNGESTVSMYSIDAATGQLQPLNPATVATGSQPRSIAFYKNYAYVVNTADNTISEYSVNATTGVLTLLGTTFIADGASPWYITTHGDYVYVADQGTNTISIYSVNLNTGGLSLVSSADTGYYPSGIAFANDYAYVSNNGDNTVSIYQVDPSTGNLTFISLVDSGNSPLAVVENNDFMYVVNSGDGSSGGTPHSVSMYSIATNGQLASLNPSTVTTDSNPYQIAFSGNYAYVVNYFGGIDQSGNMSTYSVDSSSGVLTGTDVISTNMLGPMSLVANNGYLYVANNGGNNVSMYSIEAANGQLTPLEPGTVDAGAEPAAIVIH